MKLNNLVVDKFSLRSFSVAFEVPFFDRSNTIGYNELAHDISSRYRDWFDALKTELSVIELPSTNKLILYTIVIRVDSDLATRNTIDSDWERMQIELINDLEKFMKVNKLDYRIIKQEK